MTSHHKDSEGKRTHAERMPLELFEKLSKLGYMNLIKFALILMILLFLVTFVVLFKGLMDSPLFFGAVILVFLLTLHYSGLFKNLGELTLEAILVIILTVVFIQVSYPFFSPKVDIISSEIVKGYSDDTGDYVFEIFSATVKKPILMGCGTLCGNYCTDISFFNGVWGEVNGPEVNITKIGDRRVICTYGKFDMMTRMLKFTAAYPQPLDYEMGSTNLTSADRNFSAGRYVFNNEFTNNLPFPLSLKYKTVTFMITEKTMIPTQNGGDPRYVSLYDTMMSNYQRNNCASENLSRLVSNSLRVSDSTKSEIGENLRGYSGNVRINENKKTIEVDMKISGVIEPEKRYPFYVFYEPSQCLR